jgi:hypothetical protein
MLRRFIFFAVVAVGFVMAASEWWYQLTDMLSLFTVKPARPLVDRREASLGPSRPIFPSPKRAALMAPTERPRGWGQEWGQDHAAPVGEASPEPPSSSFLASAKRVADAFLRDHQEQWQIRPYHDLRGTESPSPSGGATVKYEAYQDGIPILGSEISIEVTKDLQVSTFNNGYRPVARADLGQAVLSSDEVIDSVTDRYLPENDVRAPSNVLVPNSQGEAELAYMIPMRTRSEDGGMHLQMLFRAADGRELHSPIPPVGPAPSTPGIFTR